MNEETRRRITSINFTKKDMKNLQDKSVEKTMERIAKELAYSPTIDITKVMDLSKAISIDLSGLFNLFD